MTETDWLTTDSPDRLFRHVRTKLPARKLQLLACACARLIWDVLSAEQQQVVEAVERFADWMAGNDEHARALNWATQALTAAHPDGASDGSHEQAVSRVIQALVCTPADDGLSSAIDWVIQSFARRPPTVERMATVAQVRRWVCDVFREVVGNPFRERVVVTPTWVQNGGTVVSWMVRVGETARAVAAGIQADQAFDRMPILADALEDDGCSDFDLLTHLRESRPHCRGCWALDLVLGKG